MLASIYRPPSASQEYLDNILNAIQRAKDMCEHIIVLGDLNFDYSLRNNQILYIESLFNMKQLINSPTRVTLKTKSLLDVILTTNCERHANSGIIEVSLSDHSCVFTEYILSSKTVIANHKQVNFRDYNTFSIEAFMNDLLNCNAITACEFDDSDLEHKWTAFKETFLNISNKHAPMKNMRLKNRHNPWITKEIVRKMYRRDYLKKQAVRHKDCKLWNEYKSVRNGITKQIKAEKKAFYCDKFNECRSDCKKVWKLINSATNSQKFTQLPPELNPTMFNEYFSSVGQKLIAQKKGTPEDLPWKQPPCPVTFKFDPITEKTVHDMLKKFGDDSVNDVLGFDSKLLHLSRDIISPILCKLFNASLTTSKVLNDWKLARVTPVYKEKGDIRDMSNYRPISVIGHISKLFESKVHEQLQKYLQLNNYISNDQSAYLKQHNTQTALHRVVDDWIDNICSKSFTGICSFDIKKCFDSIDHSLLLAKMKLYGIRAHELNWFEDYLSDRRQVVRCHNKQSEPKCVSVGVPQGSVLGPLLFVLFVNDISQHVGLATANLYADDTLIYINAESEAEINEKLQGCVDKVSEWYEKNNIIINTDKSCSMIIKSRRSNNYPVLSISIENCIINQVKTMTYLGLEIDEALTWNQHIMKLCRKLSFKISRFARLSRSLPKNVLIKVYNSSIQPCIDYVISIWGSTSQSNLDKVQRLQNHAARIVENNFDYINTRGMDLVMKLNWMNVRERFFYFQTLLIFKCIHGFAPVYLTNNVLFDFEISKKKNKNT